MDDVNFLVNRKNPGSRSYLSCHSVNRGGVEIDTLDVAVFDGASDCFTEGGECRGLLFFHHGDGRVLICNPTTKERKFLPPSQLSDPLVHGDVYEGYGFGYDESSQDFKILRFFKREGKDTCECNPDLPMRAEIYSFKKNSWKRIRRCPKPIMSLHVLSASRVAAFVNGNLYWVASFSDDVNNVVLSYNLAAEDFSIFPLPCPMVGMGFIGEVDEFEQELLQDLFELDGELGAFAYGIADETEPVRTCVEEGQVGTQIWVWKPEVGSWTKKFDFPFGDVVKPLGLKNGRLYLEVRTGVRTGGDEEDDEELSQLRVYNMHTGEFVNLEVYASWGMMEIFPFRPSTFPLPKDLADANVSREWI